VSSSESGDVTARRTDAPVVATERWFLRRGTPHLIEGYSATADVFTRALPALALIFLASVAGAGHIEWRWWQNLVAVLAGFVVLLLVWAIVNRLRDRPGLQRPDTIGAIELAAFVAGPALLQLLTGQARAALVTAITLGMLLLLVYVVTSYALLPMSRWALGKTARELGAVVDLLARALPLLLLIQLLAFFTTELWQIAAELTGLYLAVFIFGFFAIGVAFLCTRLPGEIDRLTAFDDLDELRELCAGTPVELAAAAVVSAVDHQHLSRRQRGNVLLVALFSQGLQVILVTIVLGICFVGFGVLAVSADTTAAWVGHAPDVVAHIDLGGRTLVVTAELLKLATFLAAFSGLYFAVTLVTDDTYRREFFDRVVAELRQTFAVRAVYLSLVSGRREGGER
jgi:hypothetical protein